MQFVRQRLSSRLSFQETDSLRALFDLYFINGGVYNPWLEVAQGAVAHTFRGSQPGRDELPRFSGRRHSRALSVRDSGAPAATGLTIAL